MMNSRPAARSSSGVPMWKNVVTQGAVSAQTAPMIAAVPAVAAATVRTE